MSAAAGLMALTRKNALSLITKFASSWRLRQKFFSYQLNKTALLNVDKEDELTTRNVCWHLPEKYLYRSAIHDAYFASNCAY